MNVHTFMLIIIKSCKVLDRVNTLPLVKKVMMSKDCPSDAVQAVQSREVYHFDAIELC